MGGGGGGGRGLIDFAMSKQSASAINPKPSKPVTPKKLAHLVEETVAETTKDAAPQNSYPQPYTHYQHIIYLLRSLRARSLTFCLAHATRPEDQKTTPLKNDLPHPAPFYVGLNPKPV